MQNPFLRLKHYRTDQKDNDAKENHATESLAACLVFSPRLRADFLTFLFDGKKSFSSAVADRFSVTTQLQTDVGGWVDLLIENPGECAIVIEVKVGAPEDGGQIREYKDWLSRTRSGEHHVFSLVQRPSPSFRIEQFGGARRCTWRELHHWFSEHSCRGKATVEGNLLDYLCAYLEAESIVSIWKPADLVSSVGKNKASGPVESVLRQVETRLLDADENYLTGIELKYKPWPRLEVGQKTWAPIFGAVGSHKKVYLYYQYKDRDGGGMTNAEQDQFYITILLWSKWHLCDWNTARRKLPQWLSALRLQGFADWFVPGDRTSQQGDALGRVFHEPPNRVNAEYADRELATLTARKMLEMSSAEVVDALVERLVSACDAVSRLA